jgi:CBS domain containing-hemolysin-like protein
MKIVYVLLALGLLKIILIYKLYNSVPALELKRLAKAGDKRATALYKVANYEAALDVFLWVLGTAAGAGLFIWSARTSWWLASVVLVASAYLIIWLPAPRWDGPVGAVAAFAAKYYASVLSFLNPVLGRIGSWLPPAGRIHFHSDLYEKKDLLELLNKQNKQLDNRIDENDLKIAFGAISFGDKLVRDVMTPRRELRFVTAGEAVGPMLMDELHKTGHSRFPVVKESTAKDANPQIVGTLYLKDIINMQAGGKVKDYSRKDVYYINEDSNLRQALAAFLKTHHHLLIVVNNFEEIAGVLSMEDVFEQIIGQPINDEFDSYDSLRAVAAKEAKEDKENHNEVPVAPTEE